MKNLFLLAATSLGLICNVTAVEPGDTAPLLSAVDQDGKTVNLADTYKKGPTLVYFYPKADTPGCTTEACSLRDSYQGLENRGLQILGVSEDKVASQKKFQEKYKLPFPLLADNDGKVAAAFGVPTTLGFAKRQSFLINDGKVVWKDPSVSPKTHVEMVGKALDALKK